jgi:hypothetical protein
MATPASSLKPSASGYAVGKHQWLRSAQVGLEQYKDRDKIKICLDGRETYVQEFGIDSLGFIENE